MPRTFIAVHIDSPPALSPVLDALSRMGRAVKAVEPHNLHITLRFLGEVDADLTDLLAEAITQAAAGERAHTIALQSLGAFPHVHRPSVTWAGVTDSTGGPLIRIATRLESLLNDLGFASDDRPFSPHLTLARIKAKPPPAWFELIQQHESTPFGECDITEVRIVRSELTPTGPIYTPACVVALER